MTRPELRRAGQWLGIAGLVALAIAVFAWFAGRSFEDEPSGPASAIDSATAPPPAAASTVGAPAPEAATTDSQRELATADQTTPPEQRKKDYPQGLEGLVVDHNQQPMGGVAVYLIESARNEPLALPALREQGMLMGPVAETRSDRAGMFAVGLALASDKLYELRFLAPGRADARVGDLRVLPDEWHDIGRVTMVRGTTVRGRVTVEGTSTPVPQAVVTVEAGSSFEDAVLHGIPGRERGLFAIAGSDGSYTVENAPAVGIVRISAVAAGFARVIQHNVDLSQQQEIVADFALPPGLTIAGHVVDRRQRGIGGARVEARPAATSAPSCTERSRADGSFEIVGLREGPHLLRVRARGYQDLDLPDLVAGRRDVEIELLPRAAIRVRVTGDGRVLRAYRLGVRSLFPAGDGAGLDRIVRLRELPDQRVGLDGMTDRVTVEGIPTGEFVVQVAADGYAKTVSKSFVVAADGGTVEVDVEMTRGGTLRGRIVDERDNPIAGATIKTQLDGARPDDPVWRQLVRAAPDRITALDVESDQSGAFELRRLAYGDYQLEVHHPDACRTVVRNLAIRDSVEVDLGAIRMLEGAIVFGRATTDGRVEGQVKVVLTSVPPEVATPSVAVMLRVETVTDGTGAFTLPRRVPPGEYEIRAAAIDAADPDTQVFRHLLQMQRSATRFTVAAGQRHSEQHINVATRR